MIMMGLVLLQLTMLAFEVYSWAFQQQITSLRIAQARFFKDCSSSYQMPTGAPGSTLGNLSQPNFLFLFCFYFTIFLFYYLALRVVLRSFLRWLLSRSNKSKVSTRRTPSSYRIRTLGNMDIFLSAPGRPCLHLDTIKIEPTTNTGPSLTDDKSKTLLEKCQECGTTICLTCGESRCKEIRCDKCGCMSCKYCEEENCGEEKCENCGVVKCKICDEIRWVAVKCKHCDSQRCERCDEIRSGEIRCETCLVIRCKECGEVRSGEVRCESCGLVICENFVDLLKCGATQCEMCGIKRCGKAKCIRCEKRRVTFLIQNDRSSSGPPASSVSRLNELVDQTFPALHVIPLESRLHVIKTYSVCKLTEGRRLQLQRQLDKVLSGDGDPYMFRKERNLR